MIKVEKDMNVKAMVEDGEDSEWIYVQKTGNFNISTEVSYCLIVERNSSGRYRVTPEFSCFVSSSDLNLIVEYFDNKDDVDEYLFFHHLINYQEY